GEQHQLPVGEDDLAVLRHQPEPVAVAVESDAELGFARVHGLDQFLKILRLRRIGVMVRKAPVDFAIKLLDLASETPIKPRREHPRDAVAAVDGDAEGARELDIGSDALDIGIQNIRARALARSGAELSLLDAPPNLLYVLAPKGVGGDHHLEAVLV